MKLMSFLRDSASRLWSASIGRLPEKMRRVVLFAVVFIALLTIFLFGLQALIAATFEMTIPATPLDTGFESGIVTQPPPDLSDPPQDVLGWERGYWYSEPIEINVSDGLTEKERHAMLGRTIARVEVIRKEEFTQMWVYHDGPVRSFFGFYQKQPTSIELVPRHEIKQNGGTNVPPNPLQDTLFEVLFLVGENVSGPEIYERMLSSAQLAHYSPRTNSIVLVTGPNSKITETILAHELTHALQDQHDLPFGSPHTIDNQQVKWTRVEGVANTVKRLYEKRCGAEWECWGKSQSEPTEFRYQGRYALRYFPYSEGTDFVMNLYQKGGWDAINRLHRNPPASTEQIIYNSYPNDQPVEVSVSAADTDDWEQLGYALPGAASIGMMFHRTTLDEYNRTSVIIEDTTERYHYANRYVKGWEGGRIEVYQNTAGKTGYVWKTVWESSKQAREFVKGYRRLLSHWGGEQVKDGIWIIQDGPFADAFSIRRSGDTVLIVNSPTVSALDEIRPKKLNDTPRTE